MDDLIKSLLHGKFRRSKRTGRNILESEHFLLLVLRSLDQPDYSLLYHLCKPDKYQGIDSVEESMKHRQAIQRRCCIR